MTGGVRVDAWDRVARFLDELPAGPEKDWHSFVSKVIRDARFDPDDDLDAISLLSFLRYAHLKNADGTIDTATHPATGSTREDAELIARIFHRGFWQPPVWNRLAITADDSDELRKRIQRWAEHFAGHPTVGRVD